MARHELKAIDTVVAAAKHAGVGRETEYQIAGLPGLRLVVQKTGSKAWRYDYSITLDGKRQKRKVKLGPYPRVTLADARRQYLNLADRFDREGDFVAADKSSGPVGDLTFAALVEIYLKERAALTKIKEVERELRYDALPALGHMRPADIQLTAWPARSSTAGRSPWRGARSCISKRCSITYC